MVDYECVRCRKVFPKGKWDEMEGRCPNCRYRVAKKIRPPVVKRVKAQ